MSITNYPDADFTPDIPNSGANTGKQSYNPTGSFRFWAQKVLPTVYDDSLSYYEILTKVVNYLNAVIQNVDSLNDSVDNTNSAFDSLQGYVNSTKDTIISAYNELQSYVNTYFDSLDVQEEINAKLDGMASDGSLSEVVSPFIPSLVSDWLSDNITPTSPAIDASLSVSGAGADAKVTGEFVRTNSAELTGIRAGADGTIYPNAGDAVRGQVSDLNSALNDGKEIILKGYWAESWTSGNGGNIYKSDSIIIPAGETLKNVRYKPNSDPSSIGYIYVLDENNKILDKFSLPSTSASWQTCVINKKYAVDAYIAISGLSIANTYSLSEQEARYSLGLYEASETENTKQVGDIISFAHNVPTRYYSFAVDATYKTTGLTTRINALENKVSEMEPDIILNGFTMPKVYDTSEEGYTLLGRWYSFSTFDECCNSAGAGIMFKIKGATSVSVDIEQVVHPSHSDWRMSVEPYIAYSVDGSAFTRAQIGNGAISIPISSTDEHLIWVIVDGMCLYSGSANRNSGWSAVYINSITTDGHMYKVTPASKQILFVGDSIVEGINTLGTTSTSEANSAVSEFSFKTARKLNSIPILQGYGGSTSFSGLKYERYSYVDSSSNSFIVNNKIDAILIEYGFNDASAGYTTEQFKQYYNELIDLLVGHYSGVPVFCLIPFKQSFAQAIREIASARSYCYCIETSDYEVTYSDNAHPNASGATSIADSLSEDIIKIMGKGYFV